MGLKDEISDHHRRESLGQEGMVSGEELLKGYEIAIRFAHLLAVDGNHIVVHPAFHGLMPLGRHALRYLAFMVGEHEVHAAAMDIEHIAEIFPAHGGAFEMPSGKTLAPGTRPVHYMLRSCLFPQCEI